MIRFTKAQEDRKKTKNICCHQREEDDYNGKHGVFAVCVVHLFPEAFLFSSVRGLQPPEEPPPGQQQQKSKATTKQAAVGEDISTYMANVIFF